MTRQIIVSDIALLRANGQPIAAERRGYFLKKEGGVFKTVICRHDADEFAKKSRELNAAFLCDLTGGVHIHTLSVPDEASYERIVAALNEKGILLSD